MTDLAQQVARDEQMLAQGRAALAAYRPTESVSQPKAAAPVQEPKSEATPFEKRALPLIARGVPIIPLRPESKIAFITGWEQKASRDRGQIQQWANQYPNANVASVAKAQPDGVWFFEVDRENFHLAIEQQTGQKMPETFMVRSSPGRGHLYFRQTPASIAMGNRQGKDEKGEIWSARVDDRYVVGPLSIHPTTKKNYEVVKDAPIVEAPEWLVEWCIKNDSKSDTKKPAHESDRELITEGSRNNFLTSKLGRAHQQNGLEYDALLALGRQLNQQHCIPPLPEKEVETIAGSITKYPIKPNVPVKFEAYQTQQTQPDRPMETESVNPSDVAVSSLDWLPQTTLASTRLQDIYMEHFQDNHWPLSLALPALVTAASVVVPPTPRDTGMIIGDDMVNLYTALIAPIHAGKSQMIEWACRAIGIYDDPIGSHYYAVKSGSAEQLIKNLHKKQSMFTSKACLINPDEWAHLFHKAAIPDASFPTVLSTSFYKRNQIFTLGGTDGGKEYGLNLAMSFIGGIVEDEFDSVFGASSLGGLYDRFLFGRAPDGFKWSYVPCPIPLGPYFRSWDLKPVRVNPSVYEVTKAWGKEMPGLGRIAEVCVRVATIYACLDGRPEVQASDIEALKPLALYQMGLRQVFRPNPGKNPDAVFANKALAWIEKYAGEWTSIAKLKQHTWRVEQELGPQVAVRSLLGLARSGRIELWLAYEGKPLPSDYHGPNVRIGLVRRVK